MTTEHPQPDPDVRAVIFDMDGCLVDSEPLALEAVAAEMRAAGLREVTAAEVGEHYLGVSMSRIVRDIEARLGRPCCPDFSDRVEARLFSIYETDLKRIEGAESLLRRLAEMDIPFAVASGASLRRLQKTLQIAQLDQLIGDNGFSADLVAHGKPAPDVFLLAAEKIGIAPQHCAVLEDSPHGIKAAIAAGMRAIGFVGGSHLTDRAVQHAAILRAAGAHQVITHLSDSLAALIPAPPAE